MKRCFFKKLQRNGCLGWYTSKTFQKFPSSLTCRWFLGFSVYGFAACCHIRCSDINVLWSDLLWCPTTYSVAQEYGIHPDIVSLCSGNATVTGSPRPQHCPCSPSGRELCLTCQSQGHEPVLSVCELIYELLHLLVQYIYCEPLRWKKCFNPCFQSRLCGDEPNVQEVEQLYDLSS